MRCLVLLFLLLGGVFQLEAAEPCVTIHGRANLYGGDLQLRIWHIGTHHEYEPDESSWDKVFDWLYSGVKKSDRQNYAIPASSVYLFADFLICPTEPFKEGSVQQANVKSASHRRYVPVH
jgi:hypothetical protein